MTLKRNERYPGRFSNPTAAHPLGAFKNRTAPNAQDGSYLEQDWANDIASLHEAILVAANVTPNGQVDTAISSQVWTALQSLVVLKSQVGNGTNQVPDMNFFPILRNSAGYQRFPTGMIIQWDSRPAALADAGANGGNLYSFPVQFPTACAQIVTSYDNGNAGAFPTGAASAVNTSTYRLRCSASSGSYVFRMIAVGY